MPGCATGEEVYSIAILLYDFLEAGKHKMPVQIFGTDLNDSQIIKARTGKYPQSIASDIPLGMLKKYYTHSEDGYKISRTIRDIAIFQNRI